MPDLNDPTKQTPPAIVAPVRTGAPDVVVPPADPVVAPVVAAPPPPVVPPAGGDSASRAVTIGDDGDIPADAELLTLSKGAFKSRLARASRAELKERFGTDNPEEITAQLEELKTFKAEKEATRLAALSELEREKEARLAAEGERDEWRRQHDELRTTQVVKREHSRVEGIASKHVDPTMQRFALAEFAAYLGTKPAAEVDALTDVQVEEWFVGKVKEMPKLAKDFAMPVTPPSPVTEVKPLTNGPAAGANAPPPTGAQPVKNFSPTATNPMGRQEARAEAAKEGYRY